jgi:hypothetical protein
MKRALPSSGPAPTPSACGRIIFPPKPRFQHIGIYDFQRDKATNSYFDEYVPAANYAIGVYMAGAGYSLAATYAIAQGYAMGNSSNWYNYWSRGRPWIKSGWEDGRAGYSTESTCRRISAKSPPYRLRSIKPGRSASLSVISAPTLPSIEERQSARAGRNRDLCQFDRIDAAAPWPQARGAPGVEY